MSASPSPVLDPVLLASVLGYIDQNFSRSLSMTEIAQAVGRSPAHLTTMLRRATGKTLLGWVTERRINEARRLLTDTSLPVSEVALRVGYTSPSAFSRAFSRHVGESPARYRSRRKPARRSRGPGSPAR